MDNLKDILQNKYGTLTNAADKLGIDESTLHRNIKRLTPKFAFRLRKLGIIVPDAKAPRKNVVVVDSQEVVIIELRKQIFLLEKLVEEKDKRIKELERE